MPENPSAPKDFNDVPKQFQFDSIEEAAFWVQGYCELASDTLESLRETLIGIRRNLENFVDDAEGESV